MSFELKVHIYKNCVSRGARMYQDSPDDILPNVYSRPASSVAHLYEEHENHIRASKASREQSKALQYDPSMMDLAQKLASDIRLVYAENPYDHDDESWSWDRFNSEIDTCDLVYFMCRTWSGILICCMTCTQVSHVGVVVTLNSAVGHVPRGKYMLECVWHKDNAYDYLSQSYGRAGVRLVNVYEKLYTTRNEYIDVTVHRMLRINTLDRPTMAAHIVQWLLRQGPMSYHASAYSLAMSWLDFPGASLIRPKPVYSYICSELVARAYVEAGILPTTCACEEITPGDFYYGSIVLERGSLSANQPTLLLDTIPAPTADVVAEWGQRPVNKKAPLFPVFFLFSSFSL